MLKYKILSISDKQEWKDYLNKLPIDQQDVYYTPEYYSLYENYGDGKAQCFVFEKDGDIALYPFLLNSVNELGYDLDDEYFDIQGAYGYNGVLASNYSLEFRSKFYKAFSEYCNDHYLVAEFTRFHPLLNNHLFSDRFMNDIYNRKTVYLNLQQNKDYIWNNSYSSANRNMIRKAKNYGIEIFKGSSIQDYKVFYSIYVETMDNVGSVKYLYFNEDYFFNLKGVLPINHKLILAKHNDQIIGGMILMFQGDYAHYHLSARKAEFGKLAANNLLLDYSVDVVKQLGCKFFHFGGGNTSSEDDGLYKFKRGFSKTYSEFYIGKKIHNQTIYNKIFTQWKEQHPISFKDNLNKILGYREI